MIERLGKENLSVDFFNKSVFNGDMITLNIEKDLVYHLNSPHKNYWLSSF